jgi:hypothetical protein
MSKSDKNWDYGWRVYVLICDCLKLFHKPVNFDRLNYLKFDCSVLIIVPCISVLRGTLYPQKLALSSPTSGGRSVGIVRSGT